MLFLVWLFVFFGVAGAAYLSVPGPPPAAQAQTQTTFIYAADGTTQLAALNTGQNRVSVHLNQVPQVAIDAVLASEDHNYYQHGGVDPARRGPGPGQRPPGPRQPPGRLDYHPAVREAGLPGLATHPGAQGQGSGPGHPVQRELTKDQILERYLNTIYWGRGAYGIQAASQAYFAENVEQLTLPQAAFLAGLIRGPELADPVRAPAVAEGRRSETLASMVRYHKITQAQADEANAIPLPDHRANATAAPVDTAARRRTTPSTSWTTWNSSCSSATSWVSGLRVTTTIDLKMQDQAYSAIYGTGRPVLPAAALRAPWWRSITTATSRPWSAAEDYATSQVEPGRGPRRRRFGAPAGLDLQALPPGRDHQGGVLGALHLPGAPDGAV